MNRPIVFTRWPYAIPAAALVLTGAVLHAQQRAPGPDERFAKTTAMIAMRDGIRLNTAIFAPKEAKTSRPVIFLRTPYGIEQAPTSFREYLKDLVEEGYIFVFQDIRGRFKSEGQFVMGRPPRDRNDAKAIDESTDTYDTI